MFVFAGPICRHYQQSSHCFEYPIISLLKPSHQKNTYQIFLPKKNSGVKKHSTWYIKTILKNAQNFWDFSPKWSTQVNSSIL